MTQPNQSDHHGDTNDMVVDNFDARLDEIVGDFDTWCRCGGDDCLRYNNYKSAKQAIKQLISSHLGAIIYANIDPDYAVDTDSVYEVLMEWMGELQGGGDE